MNQDIKRTGLIRKYHLSKSDGSSVPPAGDFFVLRLDTGGGDPKHIEACRKALRAYNKVIGGKPDDKPEEGKQYSVTKADGSPVDSEADYFVLCLNSPEGKNKHVAASIKAITTYAKAIKRHLPKLADELLMNYDPKAWRPYFGDGRSAG